MAQDPTTPEATDPPKKSGVVNEFLEVVRNPTARTYALIASGGLLATVAILYLFYFTIFGAVGVFVIGLLGILSRWSSAPVMFVLAVSYFVLCPFGLPVEMPQINMVPDSHLRFADLMLVATALVHLIGLFRYYSAIHIGMPFDAPKAFVKPGAKPTLRPRDGVPDPELWKLFIRAGVFVLVGQLLWLLIAEVRIDFRRVVPFSLMNRALHNINGSEGPTLPNTFNRLLLFTGVLVVTAFVVWFVTWYWRLAGMNRDEARMVLVDEQWTDHRRDLNRPESWRGWTKRKLAGTLPKKGCGSLFLVIGLPLMLALLFVIIVACAGGFSDW